MYLSFKRVKLLNTDFCDENGSAIFRTRTTQRSWMPIKTEIYRVKETHQLEGTIEGSLEDIFEEGTQWVRLVATINWRGVSQKHSTVTFGGYTTSLAEFLKAGPGFLNNDASFNIKGQIYMWKSNRFNPTLFDMETQTAMSHCVRPRIAWNCYKHQSHLLISPVLADDKDHRVLDKVFVTFLLYKNCRDFSLPFMPRWWRGVTVTTPCKMVDPLGWQSVRPMPQKACPDDEKPLLQHIP